MALIRRRSSVEKPSAEYGERGKRCQGRRCPGTHGELVGRTRHMVESARGIRRSGGIMAGTNDGICLPFD